MKTRKVIVAMDLECLKVRHLCEDVGHVGPKTCLDVKNSFVEVSHVSHKACLLVTKGDAYIMYQIRRVFSFNTALMSHDGHSY